MYRTRRLLIYCLLFFGIPAFAALPAGIAGTLLVVSKTTNSISLIDIGSGQMIGTLPTGKGPHELVVTTDGLWAVSTNYVGGNSLTVFDVKHRKVARTIDLSDYPRPHGIQFFPDNRRVAVSSEASKTVVVVDIYSGKILDAIDTQQSGSHMVALNEAASLAYTTNMQSDSVSVLDIEKRQLIKTIDTPVTPEALTVSRSGHEIWLGANGKGLVAVLRAENGTIVSQWEGFGFPYRVLLTRDEKFAMVPDFYRNTMHFFDAEKKQLSGVLNLEKDAGPQGVALHPNDRIVFLSLNKKHRVVAIDIERRTILAEFKSGKNPDGIAYSAIVFDTQQSTE